MWSGPRTVSTALMRAWENRPDTAVTDEPLYAFYLDRTGLDHPGRDAVIASQPTDWRVVLAEQARGPLPGGAVIGYAKHMTHHLLPEVDRAALAPFRHAHLIRDPRELLALLRQGPGRTHPGRSRPAPAGGDLRDVRRPGGRFARPADRARAAPCARSARRSASPFDDRDAGLAGRAAGQRRGVGAVLVRRRLGLDRLRPLPAADRAAARPPRAVAGAVPALLRRACTDYRITVRPEVLTCCRRSMSATAT